MHTRNKPPSSDPLVALFAVAAFAPVVTALVLGAETGRLVAAGLIVPLVIACALDSPGMRSILLHPFVLAILLWLMVTGSEPAVHAYSLSHFTNIQHYEVTREYVGLPWYDSWFFPAIRTTIICLFAYGTWLIRDILGGILTTVRDRFGP